MIATDRVRHFESVSATGLLITACGRPMQRRRFTSTPIAVTCKRCCVHVANIAQSLDLFGRALAIDIENKETTTMSTKSTSTITSESAAATLCCICGELVELRDAGLCGDCGGHFHAGLSCDPHVEAHATPCRLCARRRALDVLAELHGVETLAFHEAADRLDERSDESNRELARLAQLSLRRLSSDELRRVYAEQRCDERRVLEAFDDTVERIRSEELRKIVDTPCDHGPQTSCMRELARDELRRRANVEGDVAPLVEQSVAPWVVPAVSIGSSDVVEQLVNALGVIALTPHIAEYLRARDPKALVQVKRAIRAAGRGELLAKSDDVVLCSACGDRVRVGLVDALGRCEECASGEAR